MLTRSTEDLEPCKQSHIQIIEERLLISGLGGGGIVTMGEILANAALQQYQHVAWFPCYNTMMRGGDSECCLVFSQRAIPSPIVFKCTTVIVMGAVQCTALEERVGGSGLMIIEGVVPANEPTSAPEGIRMQYIPATQTARRLGNYRNANIVMMGAYIGLTKAIYPELVQAGIEGSLRNKGLSNAQVEEGKKAFEAGINLAAGFQR